MSNSYGDERTILILTFEGPNNLGWTKTELHVSYKLTLDTRRCVASVAYS